MESTIDRIAQHLKAQREMLDPITRAGREHSIDSRKVYEALEQLRLLLFDLTPTTQLRSDLAVVHGLVAGLIGVEKATRFIEQLPDVRHCMGMDVQAAYDGDPAANSYGEIIAAYPSALAVATYRIAHAFYVLDEPVVARIMSEQAHSRSGIDIHPGADIGCHFFIDHGTGVVIGETTVIGNRVKLYHGVTLGAFSNRQGRRDQGKKRHPTIEDDVTIYPNATILGGETVVGAGSVIGGNAWVTRSVPPGSRVTIEPPHLHLQTADSPGALESDYEL
jgi:serine O-acetyltransferase